MSIIYNALKKTQENRGGKRDTIIPMKIKHRAIPWMKALSLTAIACVALIGFKHYSYSAKSGSPIIAPVVLNKVAPHPKLILNGVFLSDHHQVAMINNQSFTLGDQVNGMTITHITMNSVNLRGENTSLVLHPSLA